jgi:hypothetical protein
VSCELLDVFAHQINLGFHRSAKNKLPKDVRKKVEDWKFSSGALVLCLVAYSDGKGARSF